VLRCCFVSDCDKKNTEDSTTKRGLKAIRLMRVMRHHRDGAYMDGRKWVMKGVGTPSEVKRRGKKQACKRTIVLVLVVEEGRMGV